MAAHNMYKVFREKFREFPREFPRELLVHVMGEGFVFPFLLVHVTAEGVPGKD